MNYESVNDLNNKYRNYINNNNNDQINQNNNQKIRQNIFYGERIKEEFDELLIERNSHGAIWLHFAVRPSGNRHKVAFINA